MVAALVDVVAVGTDGLGRKEVIEVVRTTTMRRARPGFDNLEHLAMGLVARVPERWMVEDGHTFIKDMLDRLFGIVPGVDDARRDELKDL